MAGQQVQCWQCEPENPAVAVVCCRVEQRSPAIFSGGGHQFVSEIGLFRKLAGTQVLQRGMLGN